MVTNGPAWHTDSVPTTNLERLLTATFGAVSIVASTDVNRGNGIFSDVIRLELAPTMPDQAIPASVVLKKPAPGANGEASLTTGACEREALAYQSITAQSPLRTPICYAMNREGWFLLEDLSSHRQVDQVDGASLSDARSVVAALGTLHSYWQDRINHLNRPPRTNPLTTIPTERFADGWAKLQARWAADLEPEAIAGYAAVASQLDQAKAAFGRLSPLTIIHGDPRLGNIVFDDAAPIFLDWQQIAIGPGAADLAWFLATSLTPETRRANYSALLAAYAEASSTPRETVEAELQLAWLLPGLLSLLLATREAEDEQAALFIRVSLNRIGLALSDYSVAAAVAAT